MNCDCCANPVDLNDGRSGQRIAAIEVRSIDPRRKHGRDIVWRDHLGEFVCGDCIDKLKSGLNVGQASLL